MDEPEEPITEAERASLAWRTATVVGVVLAITISVFIVIYAASGFLLIFAGILFAVFLDALTTALERVLPVHRAIRLTLVCLVTAAAFAAFLGSVGTVAVGQTPDLLATLEEELRELQRMVREFGAVDENGNEPAADENDSDGGWSDWLPDPAGLFGQVRVAFEMTFGVLGNMAVVVVLGVFIAAQPPLYRDGLVKLVSPRSRRRFGQVLDEIGTTLRFWLIGQFVTMTIIGLVVWGALAAVGLPGAILLGLTAGILNFVPIIGPILAGIPIVLVAMAQDWWIVFYAVGVYLFIQFLEGNILTPLIQRRAVNLPPALIIGAIVIMGLLFGLPGIILATPFAAVVMVAVKRLYIEDVLNDWG
ncbi:AI-2E family transporter [Chelativorans sp. ZYF759]|uniref:AI-2E family transporter n=1 Tax=Chelativorans sp. ZYF759 TaxID=2692213 RepID=UPI00145EFB31|nr:AI-2E family transporter [Chelativorans sp. ZYF759]